MLPRRSQSTQATQVVLQTSLRAAGAEFIRGTTFGWGRRELANWLVCHYTPCVVAEGALRPDPEHAETLLVALNRLDDERVERLVLDARSGALKMLNGFTWQWQAKAIAQSAIAAGSVVAVRAGAGAAPTWAPVFRARMRLAGRVAALFVADALNAPQRYRNIALCRQCGELGFSAPVEHAATCEDALRVA